jgi:hypothetical protein
MNQPRNDPDPLWHTGPLTPVPRPVLTAGEQADWEAWQEYADHMQMRDIDQRAEPDPDWAAPAPWPDRPVTWEGDRTAENEAGREAEAGQ